MLINKRIKELARFTNKEIGRESLGRVYVDKSEAVVTDGHVLVQMPIEEQDNEAYPATTNTTEINEPVLLDTETIDYAVNMLPKKTYLPALNNIQIGMVGCKTVINAGLPAIQFPVQSAEGLTYPDYKKVIPDYSKQQPLKFAVNATHLKSICELAARHGNTSTKKIMFEVPTVNEQIAKDADGNPQFDEVGDPIMEFTPIVVLTSGLKFEIENEGQVMFHGVLMPLRIEG